MPPLPVAVDSALTPRLWCSFPARAVVFPNLLPQVGLLSYHGTVHGCLVVPDPEGDAAEGIADGYAQELRALAEALDVDLPAGVADAAR